MKKSIQTITVLIALTLISCASQDSESYSQSEDQAPGGSAEAYEETSKMTASSVAESKSESEEKYQSENHQQAVSSLAATMVNDSNMRFIRKAQLKYKTESVRNKTYFLENAIVNLGGIVTYTNLYSETESVKKIAISNDSSLTGNSYRMNNKLKNHN